MERGKRESERGKRKAKEIGESEDVIGGAAAVRGQPGLAGETGQAAKGVSWSLARVSRRRWPRGGVGRGRSTLRSEAPPPYTVTRGCSTRGEGGLVSWCLSVALKGWPPPAPCGVAPRQHLHA